MLEELQTLLKIYRITFWESRTKKSILLLQNSDYRGVGSVITNCAGNSSLGDLIISVHNGDPIDQEDEIPINKRLNELTDMAYELAVEISREVERDLAR